MFRSNKAILCALSDIPNTWIRGVLTLSSSLGSKKDNMRRHLVSRSVVVSLLDYIVLRNRCVHTTQSHTCFLFLSDMLILRSDVFQPLIQLPKAKHHAGRSPALSPMHSYIRCCLIWDCDHVYGQRSLRRFLLDLGRGSEVGIRPNHDHKRGPVHASSVGQGREVRSVALWWRGVVVWYTQC